MSDMFCFQCQQTAGNKGCVRTGVCGKQPSTANLQDELLEELIRLAETAYGKRSDLSDRLLPDGLFTTLTNVNFDDAAIEEFKDRAAAERRRLGGGDDIKVVSLFKGETDIVSLRSTLLFGMKGMAAYAHHAMRLGYFDDEVTGWFYKGLREINRDHSVEEWLGLIMEFGKVNFKCMELLDRANTETFGNPVPTRVNVDIKKGPFIVVSGHDLEDLHQLLEQTKDRGINIYTHSEMLPAHGYPELKKYPHLKGNFGTGWQNQQSEFHNIPAPILFTTNCIMPVRQSYCDRVFTTSIVSYPELVHIGADKDFTPVIERAIQCGGYEEDKYMTGMNGGHTVTTGFAHHAVLSIAEKLIEAIRSGAVSHIFLIGGCDGAAPSRSYFTEFAKQTPKDSLSLTLACGKYRINDLDLGTIQGIPRILEMGQCNDAYSAIRVALALADAFSCSVNDLPLTLVLSWYEQKAVCILLSLLALGIQNIVLGPTLPAFLSPNVLAYLVEQYHITPTQTPQQDLERILSKS